MLTPVWWDDFIYACFFTSWHVPHTVLLSSFSDVIASVHNFYQTQNGRILASFITFLFMYFKDKNIFNICNTIVYCVFVLLIGFHITGSLKKISALFFMFINILLWLMISAWGQNLLWLTGSCNYLWTSTIILLFLVPFRKRVENLTYRPHIIVSFLWIIPGILAGWSMENSASGVFILLLAYLIFFKIYKKEPLAVFEVSGLIGFIPGFFMLVRARGGLFPGFMGLLRNIVMVGLDFFYYEILLIGLIILLAIELLYLRKTRIEISAYGFFIAALGSAAAMILPGYYGGRSAFLTEVFFIITLLSLVGQVKQIVPRRYSINTGIMLMLVFLSTFFIGSKDIVKSFLYARAREQYILTEKQKGNLAIKVKSPILVSDSHNGMYGVGAIDILGDPADPDFIAHNSSKAAWYGIVSLEGIPTNIKVATTPSVFSYLSRLKPGGLSVNDLLLIIYDGW